MYKRISEKLDSWDLKSLFLTFLFLSIFVVLGIFLFYFADIRDRFRTDDKQKFKGQTSGEIVSVEKSEKITHSKWNGTRIYVDSYKVTYTYTIGEQRFKNVDVIPVTPKNQRLLAAILKGGSNQKCVVKFDTEGPARSILTEIKE